MNPKVVPYLRIVAVAAMVATIPFPVKFNNFAIIFAALVAIFTYPWRELKTDLQLHGRVLMPAVIFLTIMIGMLYTSDAKTGWGLVERSTSLIGLPLLVLLLFNPSEKNRNIVARVFEAACFALFLYCLYIAYTKVQAAGSWFNPEKIEQLTERRYYYFLNRELVEPARINPIYLGMYLNLCLAFVMARLVIDRKVNALNIAELLFFVGAQLMVGSLNSILVMLMVMILIPVFRLKRLTLKTAVLLAIPLIAIVAIIFSIKPIRQRFLVSTEFKYEWDHVGYWNGVTFRLAIWSCAKEVVAENFLTGVGTGDADTVLIEKYHEKNFMFGWVENYNAHNQYMQTWIMHGVLGLLILLVVVVAPFKWALAERNIVLAMFALIVALAFCTEVTLGTQKGIAFFSLFYALCSRRSNSTGSESDNTIVNS